jgi:hypothetical protein
MPIWLRRYTFRQIREFYEKEKEEFEKASGKNTITANSNLGKIKSVAQKVDVPSFVSTIKKSKK